MSDLEVVCYTAFDGWNCHVTVADADGTRTEHSVSVRREEFQRYSADGNIQQLIEASIRFLLEREPKESIMPRFKLSDIERYFPEYGRVIGSRLER